MHRMTPLTFLAALILITGCAKTSEQWQVTETFEVPVQRADRMVTYTMRGEEGRFGFIDAPFWAGQRNKYMWHIWGEPQELWGKRLIVMGQHQGAGEPINLLNTSLGGPNNGAAAHVPSSMSLPTPGLWRLSVHLNDELVGYIIVEVLGSS